MRAVSYIIILFFVWLGIASTITHAQTSRTYRKATLDRLITDDYQSFKDSLIFQFDRIPAGKFGTNVSGICSSFETSQLQIAFTFDACIGEKEDYNAALIHYLKQDTIPATLFVTTSWMDDNDSILKELIADTLFEIENHGLFHRVCSVDGKMKYHILSTQNVGEVIDEMELSARNLARLKGERPCFFRPATAYMDEKSVKIAQALGMTVVNFDDLSGDAIPYTSATLLAKQVMRYVHPGAIVIMHFNHPAWNEMQALKIIIPKLKAKGYTFVRLNQVKLVSH